MDYDKIRALVDAWFDEALYEDKHDGDREPALFASFQKYAPDADIDVYVHPDVPHGLTSQFLAQCLRQLKRDRPDAWAVVTYADSDQRHLGTVYQAVNAVYTGLRTQGNVLLRESPYRRLNGDADPPAVQPPGGFLGRASRVGAPSGLP